MGLSDDIFVHQDDTLSDLRCPICHDIFEDPVMGPCQCTFCRSCIAEALSRNALCPMDRRELQMRDLVSHRFVRGRVDTLEVFCSHKSVGCFWRGRLDALAGHEETCAAKAAQEAQEQVKKQNGKLRELRKEVTTRDSEVQRLIKESKALTGRVTDLNCTVRKLQEKIATQRSEIKVRDAEMRRLKEQLTNCFCGALQKSFSTLCGKRKRADPVEHG